MGCNCDKKDKASKDTAFTKAVVEINNPEQIVLLRKVVIPASMGTEQDVPATIGKYKNVILEYEANKHVYFYSSDGIPTRVEANIPQEIYDDIADLKINKQNKLTAGANIDITSDVISATYSNFTGTDGTSTGTAGLVPAPAATDAGKFLGADGNWDTVSAGPTVVQVAGDSTTDVMSQNATTGLIFSNPSNLNQSGVQIGKQAVATGLMSVAIGYLSTENNGSGVALGYHSNVTLGNPFSIAIGYYSKADGDNAVALGDNAEVKHRGSVALGSYSTTTRAGEVSVGTTNTLYGFGGSSNYRVISGVYDGQSDHDAVNLGQLKGRILQNAGAPTTSTVGTVGQLLEDITNGKLYICTSASNPYAWDEVGSGGGGTSPTVVQTTGNSVTDVMSQDAVSKLVYYQGNSNNGVHLGNTSATTAEATAIGKGATATANGAISLGYDATATSLGAVSFPYCHDGGATGVVNFGPFNSSFGYSNTNTRLLSGVHAPVSNTDAANKAYVDSAISNLTIPTITMTTTDPGEGSALAENHFIAVYSI